jgi:hypothetical protein
MKYGSREKSKEIYESNSWSEWEREMQMKRYNNLFQDEEENYEFNQNVNFSVLELTHRTSIMKIEKVSIQDQQTMRNFLMKIVITFPGHQKKTL